MTAPVRADPELVRRVLEETRVETRLPQPGVADYLQDLLRGLIHRISELLAPLQDYAGGLSKALLIVLGSVVTAGFVLLIAVVIRSLLRWLRSGEQGRQEGAVEALSPPEPPNWGESAWRAELERRMGRADVKGSLEATWWWIARSIADERAETSWSSRELLDRAGRRDLGDALAKLDRMRFGALLPSVGDVGDLVSQLEARLR